MSTNLGVVVKSQTITAYRSVRSSWVAEKYLQPFGHHLDSHLIWCRAYTRETLYKCWKNFQDIVSDRLSYRPCHDKVYFEPTSSTGVTTIVYFKSATAYYYYKTIMTYDDLFLVLLMCTYIIIKL
jgi:hypothetical protein